MAFFLRRVQSYAEAEDLTQEVFARLLVGKGTTDQPDVYVFRVTQNLLVDRVRKLMVRQRYREAALTEPERDLDVLDPPSIAASREEMAAFLDRKSVVSGKSVSVRIDLVGRRISKKKKKY